MPAVIALKRTEQRMPTQAKFEVGCSNCNLRELCLPGALCAEDLARVENIVYARRRLKRGEPLFQAGTEFNAVYAIRSGFFKTSVVDKEGREQVTGFHMAGELIGLDGLGSGAYNATATALEDSEVCVLPYALVEQMAREIPALQRHLHSVLAREIVRDQRIGQHAYLAVLQRHRGAVVGAGAQAVQAHQLAAHVEAGDLLAAFAVHHAGLEEAAADRVDRAELRAGIEQRLAALHAPAGVDHVLHPGEVFPAQRARQAQLAQVALGAGDLELGLGRHSRLCGFQGDHGRHGTVPFSVALRRSNSVALSKKSCAPSRSAWRR